MREGCVTMHTARDHSTLILLETSALYKLFTYLLTYLLTYLNPNTSPSRKTANIVKVVGGTQFDR